MSGPSLYFALQALAGVLWWIGLWASPEFGRWFFAAEFLERDRVVFLIADLMVFVLGSGLVAWLAVREHRWSAPLAWIVLGGTAYATLTCLGLYLEGGPLGSLASMVLALLGSGWGAIRIQAVLGTRVAR